jgi:hypothetical protein
VEVGNKVPVDEEKKRRKGWEENSNTTYNYETWFSWS